MKLSRLIALSVTALVAACPDPNVNRPCDAQGNCAAGFICDRPSNTCIATDGGSTTGGGRAGGSAGGTAGGSAGGSAGGDAGGSTAGGMAGGSAGGSAGGMAGGSAGGAAGGASGGMAGGSAGGAAGGSVDPGDGGFILRGGMTTIQGAPPAAGGFRVVNGGFEYLQPACAGGLCVYGAIRP